MALNPDEEVPQFTGYMDDPDTWPTNLPQGVTKDPTVWYAHRRTFRDGHTEWEFRRRGSGGGPAGPDGKPGDAVFATVPGNPIKTVKDQWDKDKADEDKQQNNPRQTPQPLPVGGSPTQTRNGHIYGYNPQTGLYDIDQGLAPATAGTKPQIPPGGSSSTEGTPIKDAQGNITGWDNQRPRQVIKDANGQVVWSEELTGSDLTAWRAAQQANQPQSGESQVATPNRPGWVTITRKTVQGGNSTEKVTYRGPDGKEVDTLPAETKSARKPVEGQPGVYLVSTETGGKTETHFEDEAGRTIQAPPNTPASITSGGVTYIRGADGSYAPAKGIPNPDQPLPAGLPQYRPDPNATDGAFGVVDYTNQLAALRSQRNPDGTPKLTDAQFTQLVNLAHQSATSAASRLDTIVRTQQTAQANAINQRNADQTASVNRLTAANSATKDALDTSMKMAGAFTPKSYAAAGGPMFSAVMGIQDMRANQWGGTYQPQPVGTAGYPALDQVVGMGLVPGQTPTVPPVATLTGQPAAPTPPNAIGLGGIGSVVAPGAVRPSLDTPVASGFDPAAAAAAEAARRQQTAASAPPPAPATVVAPSQLGQGQDLSTPVQMVPPQQQQMMAMAGPQQQPMVPAVNTLGIMASLGHKYPPEVLRQAAAELGW